MNARSRAVWTAGLERGPIGSLTLSSFFQNCQTFILPIFHYMFWPSLLAIPVIVTFWLWSKRGRFPVPDAYLAKNAVLLLLFSVMLVVVLSAITPIAYFRYLAPIIPIAALMVGLILNQVHVVVGMVVLAVVVLWSPIQRLTLGKGDTNDISTYLYEITHDYNGPLEGIVEYLNAHAKKTDVVLVTYEDLPIKFYTPLRVMGGLTGENLAAARNADWLIARSNFCSPYEIPVRQFMITELHGQITQDGLQFPGYRKITLYYPDIAYENREDPEEHLFRTATNAPPIMIFKKIAQPSGSGQ